MPIPRPGALLCIHVFTVIGMAGLGAISRQYQMPGDGDHYGGRWSVVSGADAIRAGVARP